MPEFAYIARNAKGEKITGTLSAGSEREAASTLSGQALFPVAVNAEKSKSQGFGFGGRVRPQLMANTYSQLASLLRSGVPLLRSIAILRDQTSNAVLKEVLDEVFRKVEDGASLAEAMARHPRAFSEMAVNLVRAGGEGGFLEEALSRVATFTDLQEDLKSRTVGALAYPLFLATTGFIVVGVLIVFYVPKFADLFDELRQRGELPMLTDLLLNLSDTMRSWWGLIGLIGTIIAGLFVWTRLTATEEGRRFRDMLKIRLPMLGHIFKSLAIARFCRVLGTLLKNGVPILRSLEISREATGNRVLSEAIENASENVTAGESLAAPLSKSGHFPSTVVEMISVAEESNNLDNVLIDISDDLERRTFRRLELIVRLIEPIMLLILAAVVLCVVIALLLPVIKMSSTI